MNKHTEGSWNIWDHPNPGFGCEIRSPENITIAQMVEPANARLIAAAPDLLEACKWFMQQLDDGVLLRDISKDGDPDWPMRMLRFTVSLSEASEAIARAEESATEEKS